MRRVRIGVVGCGNVAPTYLYTLARNPKAEIVCLADIDIEKARQRASEFNVPRIYKKYEEVLKDNLDAIVILTPHYEHPAQTMFFARQGLDILCEKPLAANMQDLEKMIEACETNRVKLSTMLQRRYYPNTIATRSVVEQALLGDIKKVKFDFSCYKSRDFYSGWRATQKTGGGVLMSQSLHRIDQLVYIFGSPIAVEGETKITRDYLEIEDYAKGRIFFEDGTIAEIEANNSFGGQENKATNSIIEIIGNKGRILLADDLVPIWEVPGIDKPANGNINAIPSKYRPFYYGPCHEIIINNFVDSVYYNREPAIRGIDSMHCMKIIFGFYESAKRNGARVNFQ